MRILMTVRDMKAEFNMDPFCVRTVAEGIRLFGQTVNDDRTNMSKYPGDYVLYSVGEFDENTGVLAPYDLPRQIAIGSEHRVHPEGETPLEAAIAASPSNSSFAEQ